MNPAASIAVPVSALWRRLLSDESGSGPITAWGSVLMMMAFLFLTVQVTLHLYATTQASGIALEAASRVARGEMSCAQAQTWLDGQLSGWDNVGGGCVAPTSATVVTIEVSGDSPAPPLHLFGNVIGLDQLHRQATMQREVFR